MEWSSTRKLLRLSARGSRIEASLGAFSDPHGIYSIHPFGMGLSGDMDFENRREKEALFLP
jgi:hypothetical protein